ncbi:MAG TPA: cytochrome c [Ohtaekwangia sp.]|nr:cytochrome c [Ohtaekwangia sp.]
MNRIINSRIFIVLLLTLMALPFLSLQQNKFDLKASITRGKEIYNVQCMSCHMENGEGLEGAFPPLAKSDYLMADQKRAVHQILNGLSGEITVNGKTYNGDMPAFDLTDEEVSDVLNYVQNSWGNKAEAVRPDDVKALRN